MRLLTAEYKQGGTSKRGKNRTERVCIAGALSLSLVVVLARGLSARHVYGMLRTL